MLNRYRSPARAKSELAGVKMNPANINDVDVRTALRFVHDHFCRRLPHLELPAHFLDLRKLRTNGGVVTLQHGGADGFKMRC